MIAPVKAEPSGHAPPRRRAMTITIAVFVILGLAWFLIWLFYWRFYESTDDAYTNGNLVNVTSVISGVPIAYFTDDTDYVEEGQLIVLLDDTPYQIAYDAALANLSETVLQVKQLYDTVEVNRASVKSKRTQRDLAKFDYDNRHNLIDSKAVSNEDYIHSQSSFIVSELALRQAEFELKKAKDAAGNTPIEKHPMIETQKENVRHAYYQLKHTAIYAPVTGHVAQRNVQVGQAVSPSVPLLAIIPQGYMWVDANYKETQLTDMRVGQKATVTLDIYGGGVVYKGKVQGIASGTGSVFSIIPPQNATGNWIKIVQRLPVRIELEPEEMKKFPLRVGLSAYVDVDITDTTLPFLTTTAAKRIVAETGVFEISFDEVNKVINEIISNNMR